MSKQYNLYLNSTDAIYNTTTFVYTFNVNWSFLPQDVDFFDLEVIFNCCAQNTVDYNLSPSFSTGKVMCNLRDVFSYDTNTKSNNSSCLTYIQRTNEYIDNGKIYKGSSYANCQQLFQKKTIIRPTDPNLTIFIYNYSCLVQQQNLFNNFIFYQLQQFSPRTALNPFAIILTFKPIK